MYSTSYQLSCISCSAWKSTLFGNTMYDEFDAHRPNCSGGAQAAIAESIVQWSPDA